MGVEQQRHHDGMTISRGKELCGLGHDGMTPDTKGWNGALLIVAMDHVHLG